MSDPFIPQLCKAAFTPAQESPATVEIKKFGGFTYIYSHRLQCAPEYLFGVRWSEEDSAYMGTIEGLSGFSVFDDTPENVIAEAERLLPDFLAVLNEARG